MNTLDTILKKYAGAYIEAAAHDLRALFDSMNEARASERADLVELKNACAVYADDTRPFNHKVTPSVVLGLIAEVERLTTHQEFNSGVAELDDLLNLTADMVQGKAGQDAALMWLHLLESVADKLRAELSRASATVQDGEIRAALEYATQAVRMTAHSLRSTGCNVDDLQKHIAALERLANKRGTE